MECGTRLCLNFSGLPSSRFALMGCCLVADVANFYFIFNSTLFQLIDEETLKSSSDSMRIFLE